MAQQITILYIITKLELGGAQKVCLTLFNDLPKICDQATTIKTLLITGSDGILVPHVIDKNNKNIHILSHMRREVHYTKIFQEIINFCSLVTLLKSLKKEYANLIVHTHSTKAGIIGRWAAWLAGIPIRIHTIHGYGFNNEQSWLVWLLHYIAELFTSPLTSHYVCVSQRDIVTGKKLFPNFSHKHSLIHASILDQKTIVEKLSETPSGFFTPATKTNLTSKKIIFGSIACFKPQKNLLDLLRAFAYVHANNKNTHLEIIGDGIQRNLLEHSIKKHNLTHAVTLHGWQSNVMPFLQTWDAFALSSLWEGLPCSVLEAQMFKLPVFAYDVGGIREIISTGKNGVLITPHAWLDLAHTMLDFAHGASRFTEFNPSIIDLSKENMAQKHHALYQALITKNNSL